MYTLSSKNLLEIQSAVFTTIAKNCPVSPTVFRSGTKKYTEETILKENINSWKDRADTQNLDSSTFRKSFPWKLSNLKLIVEYRIGFFLQNTAILQNVFPDT